MARVFITGIAGFIGFHLAQFLKKRGDTVVGCDNFNAYYDPLLKRQRASLLQGIEIYETDIADLEPLIAAANPTHVVHLAAQAGVRYSMKNPDSYVHTNLHGFVRLLEALRKRPETKLVYASSSSVYGANPKIPFAETDRTDAPCSLYGATKKANEALAHAYHHMYGLSVTGLRFFTVYGPWGRPDMAYFSFTDAILQGKPIQIYNEGKMERDFTYIDDIIAGVVAAIDLGAAHEIFNLGNHRPESVMTLVSLLEQLLGKKSIIEFLPQQKSEVPITYADITKSQAILGFRPHTSLEEGLDRFVNWHRKTCGNAAIRSEAIIQ